MCERLAALVKQSAGDLITHHLLLVERRVAQNKIGGPWLGFTQPVADDEAGAAAGEGCCEVVLRRCHRCPGLVDKCQLCLGVAAGCHQAESAIAAAQVHYPRAAQV